VRLLAQADIEPAKEPDETSPLLSREASYSSINEPQRTLRHETSMSSISPTNNEEFAESPTEHGDSGAPHITVEDPNRLIVHPALARARGTIFHSFPNTPNQSHSHLPSYSSAATSIGTAPSSDSGDETEGDLPTARRRHPSGTPPSARFLRRYRHHIARRWHKLNEFMTVPLWAALASLIVACIPAVQHALDEHMQPLKGAVSAAGSCSIPLTLIVLGAYFYPPPEEGPSGEETPDGGRGITTVKSTSSLMGSVRKMFKKRSTDGQAHYGGGAKERRPGETKTVAIAVLSRMIITPLLLLPLMAVSARFNIQAVFAE
jgi:hypothetical protein